MKLNKKKFLFPFFLITFIFFTLFQFFYGENGYYNHKEKVKTKNELEKENFKITLKISELNSKIKKLNKKEQTQVEEVMRNIPLIYPGETIIKVYHNSWLNSYSQYLEERFDKIKIKKEKTTFFEQYKFLIGLFVSIVLSYFLSNLLFWKDKNKPSSEDY